MQIPEQYDNIALRWSGDIPDTPSYVSWYLRGIAPDGSFYGEVRINDPEDRRIVSLHGQLSDADNLLIHAIVKEIDVLKIVKSPRVKQSQGVLSKGSLSGPQIIFEYFQHEHTGSKAEKLIFRLIEILNPYLQER